MKKYSLIIYLLFALLLPMGLCAKNTPAESKNIKFSKRFQQKWGKRPIQIRQHYSNPRITGSYPSDKTVEKCAEKFYQTLDYLPESLIRKTHLKYVTFLRNLRLNGQLAGGIASGDTIFLPIDFESKTVFHEFFHIFDPQRKDKRWTDLNDKKFAYSGSKFYEVKMTKKERRQVKKTNRRDNVAESFVSSYAMSFEHEDRAETFAHMIVEGRRFLNRTKNPVLKAKMEYIMNLFIERNLLNKDFWEKHFNKKFKLENRFYSE